MYPRKDHFYKRAKREGYASRAAYKLLEIHEKYNVIQPSDTVFDLGSAPGGWLQVASKLAGSKGKVIGIDPLPLKIGLPQNARFIQKPIEAIGEELPLADVILSDMSPNLSGIAFRDTQASFELFQRVWDLAKKKLKKGGHLVVKFFPSEASDPLQKELRKKFRLVKNHVPPASRKASSEVYGIALDYKG